MRFFLRLAEDPYGLIAGLFFLVSLIMHPLQDLAAQELPAWNVWYGKKQSFGSPGRAQRWINVLGNLSNSSTVRYANYRLNDGPASPITFGGDLHRLAQPGDFNLDIAWYQCESGLNRLVLMAETLSGQQVRDTVLLNVVKNRSWPLPYAISFDTVTQLQEVVQVVDGLWTRTPDGLRTQEPYYDRVISIGDSSWQNYVVLVHLTIHGWTPSKPGPPTYNVSHYGTALRWRGHHHDDMQPHRKWFPLGSQGEFLLKQKHDSCQWRILFDGGRHKPQKYGEPKKTLVLDEPMFVRADVRTLTDGRTRYRFKQWMQDQLEPHSYDVIGYETDDYPSGAMCIVPHNSDVTIHAVSVHPLRIDDGGFVTKPGPDEVHYSARLGGTQGRSGTEFHADCFKPGDQLRSISVCLGTSPLSLVKGLKFIWKKAHGGDSTVVIGSNEGDWQTPHLLKGEVFLTGVGASTGWFFDAIQFYFSDGTSSKRYGGEGGDTFSTVHLNGTDQDSGSRIRGFYGSYDQEGIETLGLIFDPAH